MKRIPFIIAIYAALLFTGCGEREEKHKTKAAPPMNGVTFTEKKGLHVPPESARFIGLRTEDVVERKIQTSVTFVAEIYDAGTNSLRVLASAFLKKADAEHLKPATPVRVRHGDTEFLARVAEIKTHWDGAGIEALIEIDDPEHALAPRSSVTVLAQNGANQSALSVPRTALLRTLEGTFVYTVSGDHFVRAAVQVGETNSEFVEIKDGLYAGDRVVTQPVMTLWLAELQTIRGGKACADGD